MERQIAVLGNTLQVGGLERVTLNLANGLVEKGHEVDLVLVSAEGELIQNVNHCIRVRNLEASRVLTGIPGLYNYLRDVKPDVIISMGEHMNILSFLTNRLLRSPPLQISTRHTYQGNLRKHLDPGLRDTSLRLLSKFAYLFSDEVICVSQGVCADLSENIGVTKGKVIYNPVLSQDQINQSHPLPDHPWFKGDKKVILSVGRLSPEKDFETLLRAFKQVSTHKNTKLVLIGKGPESTRLKKIAEDLGISEDICLPGFVESVYPYMTHADVFVLSSRNEGFGMVLVEAMACGCPIVSTNCPTGPAEILQDGEYGPLVPVGDVDALANSIIDVLDEPIDEKCLYQRASDFTIDTTINDYNRVIEELL